MKYPVFEAKGVLAVGCARNAHGDAGIALAGLAAPGFFRIGLAALFQLLFGQRLEFEAVQSGQDRADIGMVTNLASFDPLDDQGLDCFLDALPVAEIEHRLDHALVGGVFGTDPPLAGVPVVAKAIEIPLRSRWCRVERAVSVKFDARDQEMQLDIAHVPMAHPEDIDLIPFQTGKGGRLEILHHRRLLIRRGIVIRMEGDDTTGIAPSARVAVDQSAGQIRIARKHLRQNIPPNGLAGNAFPILGIGCDLFGQQIVHCCAAGTVAMSEKAHHHREYPVTISASWRSRAMRSVRTAIRSMARPALRSTLRARAIWLRLLPARATAARSTGSTVGGRTRRRMGSADSTCRA